MRRILGTVLNSFNSLSLEFTIRLCLDPGSASLDKKIPVLPAGGSSTRTEVLSVIDGARSTG